MRALRGVGLIVFVFAVVGCPQIAPVHSSVRTWIGHPYEHREEIMTRPRGYAHSIGWREHRTQLPNGNYEYLEPARPGCIIRWEVDSQRRIVGASTEGDRCF